MQGTLDRGGPEVSGLTVTQVTRWRDFLRLRAAWDALAAADGDACLLGHDWMAQSWKSQAGAERAQARPEVLQVAGAGERLVALAALEFHPGALRRLAFLGDRRGQRLDLVAGARDRIGAAVEALGAHLRRRRDWDLCDLNHLRQPTAEAVSRLWPALGLAVRERGEVRQRVIRLDRPWEEIERGFSPALRANFSRREKRLRRRGRLEFAVSAAGPGLWPRLQECFQLEASGWKGRRGTAILDEHSLHRFYRQLAVRLAGQGRFRLFTLALEGRIVAFEYCLAGAGALHALKIGFDESLANASPGQVLRLHLLQAAQGHFARYEFLGDDAPWKAEWTAETVRLSHLRAYNCTWRGQAVRLRAQLWQALRAARPRLDVAAALTAAGDAKLSEN